MKHAKTLFRGFAAILLILGLSMPAGAVTVVGRWDPAFGSAFPDLGWRGEATFFVPDACLGESGFVWNLASCSSGNMKILNAEVEFYSLSNPMNPALQETLLFDVSSDAVLGMSFDSGLITGVLGGVLYPRTSTLPLAGGPFTDFWLFFEDDLARMFYVSDPPEGKKTHGFSDREAPDGRPFMTFSVVPEPGAIWLLVTALLMLASISLRRVSS